MCKSFLKIFISILLGVSAAWAGGKDGGGGGVVLCEGKVRLLEIAEAEAEGKPVLESQNSYEVQLDEVIDWVTSIDQQTGQKLAQVLSKVKNRSFLKQKVVNPQPDTGHVWKKAIPKNCRLEWAGYYTDSQDKLEISKDLFDQMSETNKAAFYLHEAIYSVARNRSSEETSLFTRILVAELLRKEEAAVYKLTRLFKPQISDNEVKATEAAGPLPDHQEISFKFLNLRNEAFTTCGNFITRVHPQIEICQRFRKKDKEKVSCGRAHQFKKIHLTKDKIQSLDLEKTFSSNELQNLQTQIRSVIERKHHGATFGGVYFKVQLKSAIRSCGGLMSSENNEINKRYRSHLALDFYVPSKTDDEVLMIVLGDRDLSLKGSKLSKRLGLSADVRIERH